MDMITARTREVAYIKGRNDRRKYSSAKAAYYAVVERLYEFEEACRISVTECKSPEELAAMIAELERYRAKGTVDELERVTRCKDCWSWWGNRGKNKGCETDEDDYCKNGERRDV
jgi:hypothetical protein